MLAENVVYEVRCLRLWAAAPEDRCADLSVGDVYGWYASSVEDTVHLDALFVRARQGFSDIIACVS